MQVMKLRAGNLLGLVAAAMLVLCGCTSNGEATGYDFSNLATPFIRGAKMPGPPRVENCGLVTIGTPTLYVCNGKLYTSYQLAAIREGKELAPAYLQPTVPIGTAGTMYPVENLTPQEKSALIERLEAARATDFKYSGDLSIELVYRGDFIVQMNKADAAIQALRDGTPVTSQQLAEALLVPPTSISPEQRDQLIERLKAARLADDRNEQQMLNADSYDNMDFPADTWLFDSQKENVDRILKQLESGETVSWLAIERALYVPPVPSWA